MIKCFCGIWLVHFLIWIECSETTNKGSLPACLITKQLVQAFQCKKNLELQVSIPMLFVLHLSCTDVAPLRHLASADAARVHGLCCFATAPLGWKRAQQRKTRTEAPKVSPPVQHEKKGGVETQGTCVTGDRCPTRPPFPEKPHVGSK